MVDRTVYKVFNEMIESLGQAEGCCSQLVHIAGHPKIFMEMREKLAITKEVAMKIAPHNILMAPRVTYIN